MGSVRPSTRAHSYHGKVVRAPGLPDSPVTVEYKWVHAPNTHAYLTFMIEATELGRNSEEAVKAIKQRNIGNVIIQSETKLAEYWVEAIESAFAREGVVIAQFWMPSSSIVGGVDAERRRRKKL